MRAIFVCLHSSILSMVRPLSRQETLFSVTVEEIRRNRGKTTWLTAKLIKETPYWVLQTQHVMLFQRRIHFCIVQSTWRRSNEKHLVVKCIAYSARRKNLMWRHITTKTDKLGVSLWVGGNTSKHIVDSCFSIRRQWRRGWDSRASVKRLGRPLAVAQVPMSLVPTQGTCLRQLRGRTAHMPIIRAPAIINLSRRSSCQIFGMPERNRRPQFGEKEAVSALAGTRRGPSKKLGPLFIWLIKIGLFHFSFATRV